MDKTEPKTTQVRVTGTRAEAKAARREQLLSVAKALFATHGFHGVRLDDLGKGAGISAPAVYRHFESKEAVLEELLVGISDYLHSGSRAVIAGESPITVGSSLTMASERPFPTRLIPAEGSMPDTTGSSSTVSGKQPLPAEVLAELIDFHVDFAMSEPELIRIQDRDFAALPEASRHTVRRLQRTYVSEWVNVLGTVHPTWSRESATIRVHSVFGMMNSTPHLARGLSHERVSAELRTAARAALEIA